MSYVNTLYKIYIDKGNCAKVYVLQNDTVVNYNCISIKCSIMSRTTCHAVVFV